MAVDDQDIAAWAARIRPHFPAPQQDTAELAASFLASAVGAKIKDLRPDTPMSTVTEWLKAAPRHFCSPDWVELFMLIEDEVSSEVTDTFAETLESRSFAEYVSHLVAQKRPNKSLERARDRRSGRVKQR